jgi:hypothetical protein
MSNPGPAITATPQYVEGVASSTNPIVWGMLGQSSVAIVAPADTTEDVLVTINIPANYLGNNSRLKVYTSWTCTNNGNVKTVRVRLGGTAGTDYLNGVLTSLAGGFGESEITETGANLSQQGAGYLMVGTPAIQFRAQQTGTLDITAAQTLVITSQKANAGDTLTLVSYRVEHWYGQ